jgi:hypothetical protein
MMKARSAVFLSTLILFVSGCVTEPGLDKGKFADLNRAVRDLKAEIGSGMHCEVPDDVLQRLALGTAALQGKTASKEERDLLVAYRRLAAICKDGLLLCQYRTHLTEFPFVPKGRIYVTQELDSIVVKYDLPTEKHVYQPTGTHWRSIPGDSITVIWKSAEDEIQNIETMEKYN